MGRPYKCDSPGVVKSAITPTETLPGSGSDTSLNFSTKGSLEEDGEKGNPKQKKKNKCLAPSGGTLNLVYGVNVSIKEVGDMAELVLMGKIKGIKPNQDEMEVWVSKN